MKDFIKGVVASCIVLCLFGWLQYDDLAHERDRERAAWALAQIQLQAQLLKYADPAAETLGQLAEGGRTNRGVLMHRLVGAADYLLVLLDRLAQVAVSLVIDGQEHERRRVGGVDLSRALEVRQRLVTASCFLQRLAKIVLGFVVIRRYRIRVLPQADIVGPV